MPLIAVLSDERAFWESHAALLRDLDVEVVRYSNKVDFLLDPPRLKPDVIVTGLEGLGMDGYEVPVIATAVCGDVDPESERRAISLGAFAVLPRGTGIVRLVQVIEFAIRTRDKYHYN
jgi:FixJ family two-component response regulator